MLPRSALLLVTLIASAALAGCVGGDDSKPVPQEEEIVADEAEATEETGSITGQVVTKDLEVVAGATIGLVQGAAVEETKTDKSGKFTFNGVEPGNYRVQVAAVCCRVAIREVAVAAGEVTQANFQIQRLTASDLQVPVVDEREWNGFISCGIGSAAGSLALCAVPGIIPALADPNEDFLHEFNVSEGVRSLVVGMAWEPVGGVSGGNFRLLVENDGCGFTECSYEYADLDGAPPLIAVISDGDITEDDWKWSKVQEPRELQFRVFASGEATVVYQQPFTVYYNTYYWHEAPRDANPIPDQ